MLDEQSRQGVTTTSSGSTVMDFLATQRIPTPSPSPTPIAPAPDEEEYYSSWSLFLVCMLLILSLWTSYYLQIKRIRAVNETVVSIFAGMFVGLIVRLAPGTMIRDMLTFKHTLFFNLLLPPIILNSGYELKQENFFRNFGSILIFAFLGTFISAVGVGVLTYIYASLGIDGLDLGILECLIFGSTLSATDPVSILAIFTQYKVDPKLYSVIFGESLLNDAVSIVMYETLKKLHGIHGATFALSSLIHGTGIFLLSFTVSMALGVAFGLAMSLLLKHSSLKEYTAIESCLVALAAYTCYFFSNGLTMSGIVSLLFCGITLKHYAYHTMSRKTQRATRSTFATLAKLSENFIFVYLGLSLFTSAPEAAAIGSYLKPLFIVVTAAAVIFARYVAVFPLSELINTFHRYVRGQRHDELPHAYQMMLFWAGLRGAVGVALAAGFEGENAQVLRTTVLVVVVLTVVVFGGTSARMIELLGIRTGVEDEHGDDSSADEGISAAWTAGGGSARWNRFTEEELARVGTHYASNSYNHHTGTIGPGVSAASSESYDSDGEVLPMVNANQSNQQNPTANLSAATTGDGKWFQALDERYLLPLFSNATASRTFHARRAQRKAPPGSGLAGSPRNGSGSEGEDEGDEVELQLGVSSSGGRRMSPTEQNRRTERGLPSPVLRNSSNGESISRFVGS